MTGFLEAAVARARRDVAERRARLPVERLREAPARPRGAAFVEAIARRDRVNVIAECKRRSPSRGVLREPYDAAALARAYADHGAAAISVLTDAEDFGGSLEDLGRARAAAPGIPILRKDFLVDAYQVAESRTAGADAVLLIAAALTEEDLRGLLREAEGLGLAALVEVHDEDDLARAVRAGALVIGVNARDLRTLSLHPERSLALIDQVREGSVAVAESGLRGPGDVAPLRAAGYDAFLIGEHLVTQDDPGAALSEIVAGGSVAGAAP